MDAIMFRTMHALLVALMGLTACATADFRPAPTSTGQTCQVTPVAYCDAMPPGAGGCAGDPDAADPSARMFPTDASFPVGCTANVLAPTSDGLECQAVATCRCSAQAPDAQPEWSCTR